MSLLNRIALLIILLKRLIRIEINQIQISYFAWIFAITFLASRRKYSGE